MNEADNLSGRAASAVIWSMVQTVGSRALQASVFIVLARLLIPSDFGLVAFAAVFVALLQIFVEQGFAEAIVQRQDLEPAHLDSAFWSSLVIGTTLAGAGALSAGVIADLSGTDGLAPVLRVLAFSLVLAGLTSVPTALLTRALSFRSLALRNLFGSTVSGVVGVSCAAVGFGVWSLVAQVITGALVSSLVVWVAVDWRPRLRFSWHHFRELVAFGVNIMAIRGLNFWNRRSDDLLIGAVLGARALGIYSVAYKLLLLLTEVLLHTIDAVALPVFSRVQHDVERLRFGYLIATRLSVTVAGPVFLMSAVFAPDVVPLMFGNQWAKAIPVMQVLSLIGIVHASLYFNSTVLVALGKPRRVVFTTSVNAFSNVVAFAIAVRWGVLAVAAAYVIRGYLLSPMPLYMTHRELKYDVRELLWAIGGPLSTAILAAGAAALSRLVLEPHVGPAGRIVLIVPTTAVLYLGLLRMIAPRAWRDLARHAAKLLPERFVRKLTPRPEAS